MIGIIQGLLELVNDSVSTEVFFFFFLIKNFLHGAVGQTVLITLCNN